MKKEKWIKYNYFTNKVTYKNYKGDILILKNFNTNPYKLYTKISTNKFIKLDTGKLLCKYKYSNNLYSYDDLLEWYDKKLVGIKKQVDITYTKTYIKLLESNKLYSNIKYFSFDNFYKNNIFKFYTRDDKIIIARYSSVETNIFNYEEELTIPYLSYYIKIID